MERGARLSSISRSSCSLIVRMFGGRIGHPRQPHDQPQPAQSAVKIKDHRPGKRGQNPGRHRIGQGLAQVRAGQTDVLSPAILVAWDPARVQHRIGRKADRFEQADAEPQSNHQAEGGRPQRRQGGEQRKAETRNRHHPDRVPTVGDNPAWHLEQRIAQQKGRKNQTELGLIPAQGDHHDRGGNRDIDPVGKVDHAARGQQCRRVGSVRGKPCASPQARIRS